MNEDFVETFKNKKVLVTGGAGFVGSHLVDRMNEYGAKVTVVDNLITGNRDNLDEALKLPTCKLIRADVSGRVEEYANEPFDFIFHLASPASPIDFETIPKEIYAVNALGTHNLCEFAAETGARILFAGTSEVYGDPLEHPQKESYFGNVNPVGPRACYDESKRFGEMVMSVFAKQNNMDGRIVRIFNTYGPRMKSGDGRVIPAFISQALSNRPIIIHGDGSQTRSFCFVSDLVEYLLRVMAVKQCKNQVVNIGNPDEHSILDVAKRVVKLSGSESGLKHMPARNEDPVRRKPDVDKVLSLTDYEPEVKFDEGLRQTIDYFRSLDIS